jgi:hypothetical protein
MSDPSTLLLLSIKRTVFFLFVKQEIAIDCSSYNSTASRLRDERVTS